MASLEVASFAVFCEGASSCIAVCRYADNAASDGHECCRNNIKHITSLFALGNKMAMETTCTGRAELSPLDIAHGVVARTCFFGTHIRHN